MRWGYALTLSSGSGNTLDDLSEAVTMLEETARLWMRVFGTAHPDTPKVQGALDVPRMKLAAARAAAVAESKAPP